MVLFNFNNQNHLQLIDFMLKKVFIFLRNTAHLHFSPKYILVNIPLFKILIIILLLD